MDQAAEVSGVFIQILNSEGHVADVTVKTINVQILDDADQVLETCSEMDFTSVASD